MAHYKENKIGVSHCNFFCLLIKTNLKEEDRCFSTSFLFKCTTWDLKLPHFFCLFGLFFFFHGLIPKNGMKKFSKSFVVWNCRVLWELLQIPSVSLSALYSPIFGNNTRSHFRKLCYVHFYCAFSRGHVPEATAAKHHQVLGVNSDFFSQILLLEICINVAGGKNPV